MTNSYQGDPGVQRMLAYQAGSEGAFDDLVREYSGQVFALFTRFLGPVPEREDLVQDVFLRVIRARERYQPTARFSTWLYRIVYNLSVNLTERGHLREGVSLDSGVREGSGESRAGEVIDPGLAEPSTEMERDDVVSSVRSAIADLPEAQRMALILAKYEELPYSEIARVLDSTEKAIKSLVHRARENLRARLAPWLEQEMA